MKQLFIFSLLLFPSLASAQVIDSVSTDFLSVATAEPYTATIAVYGSDLDNLLFNPVTVTLGPLTGTVTSGDDTGINLSFTIDSTLITERESNEYLTITLANTPVVNSPTSIEIFNPFVGDYVSQASRQFVEQIDHPHKRNKQNIGLNVHWAQGSDETLDDLYSKRLEDSNTVWVREHISYEQVMGSDSAAWLKRYDEVMLRYRDSNKRVVVMLAYGTGDDEFKEPDSWKNFVRLVVKRYRNYVDVWEIWNEPDSDNYLSPQSNWRTYRHILKVGSQMVRQYDTDAIVLNGAVSDLSNLEFTKQLYQHGKRYFDDFNVHLYYCTKSDELTNDFEQLQQVIAKYRKGERIWITEFGCSTGTTGLNNKDVKKYIKQTTKTLLSYDNVGPILLYTMRDRTYLTDDPYEAYFGLMDENLSPKPVWRWYKLLSQK
ncbi:MAG: carbohydrate-binding family 9 [uncultured bacterium]|nr:MAG: carbohydrate-binding family 9 [uncultured bacterium]HBY73407.1 hypothetical protein [Candidatus Kerfeldbacteria bacterium]